MAPDEHLNKLGSLRYSFVQVAGDLCLRKRIDPGYFHIYLAKLGHQAKPTHLPHKSYGMSPALQRHTAPAGTK